MLTTYVLSPCQLPLIPPTELKISSQAQQLSHRIDLLPIADSFGILEENISFIDQDKDTIPLTNDVELKHFFEHFDQVSGGIKFVVQDLQAPDRESAFN